MEKNEQKVINTVELIIENEKNNTSKKQINDYEKLIKPQIWENTPFFGPIIYSLRITAALTKINSRFLDKNVATNLTKWIFGTLIIGFFILNFITPWLNYLITKKAIKKTKKELETN